MPTPLQSITEHCYGCGYDPLSPGTKREQIALCPTVGCNLHQHRPMPRHCRKNGIVDYAALNAIHDKIEAAIKARRDR